MAFAAAYWVEKGAPAAKIIIGMGSYGKGWTMHANSGTNMGEYHDACLCKQTILGVDTVGPSKKTEFMQEAGMTTFYEVRILLAESDI